MNDNNDTPEQQSLEQAHATIAGQAEEIEHLGKMLAGQRFAEEMRQAFATAAMTGTIASPVTHTRLLEMIVETAARVIGANAGSLFLVDEENRQLTFEVAIGPQAAEVKKFTVPMGHGIAGLVAISGQPMAVTNAQSDPRHAADIAQSVGYLPQSVLCVPLFYNESIIGVLELLDKKGAPSFGGEDMELLGYFANQAAVAIEQSRTHRNLVALIGEVLASLGGVAEHRKEALRQEAGAFARLTEADPKYHQALDLARLVQAISWRGEAEALACRTILLGFSDYLGAKAAMFGGSGMQGGW